MKDNIRKLILLLCIFAGLAVLNYPFLSQLINQKTQSAVIHKYEEGVENLSKGSRQELLAAARAYNEELADDSQVRLQDAFSSPGKQSARYEGLLNPDGSGVMGYLQIPAIQVNLPIYHGTSVRVLEAGAGHLESSSLPVGGKSTHAVISAHNGLPSKTLFTDLDQLQEGEPFFLSVLGETLAYEVDQIRTVKPEETEALRIADGEDYVTLVTCTPYGVNSHRYLVRGRRIPWEEAKAGAADRAVGKWELGKRAGLLSIGVLVLSAVILYVPWKKKR